MLAIVLGVLISAPEASAWGRKSVDSLVISSDPGGDVVNYAIRVSYAKKENTNVEFRGKCQSACTLFLSLPADQVCISPGARFSFHKAYGSSADMNDWGTRYLLKTYPAWVVDWIERKGGLTRNLIHMNYGYASKFIPACGETETELPRQFTQLRLGAMRELR